MSLNTIKVSDIWQTTHLDEVIAEEFFGWKWLAYIGRPTKSHPAYPKEIRVRRFFPPETISSENWKPWFEYTKTEPANGDEPLCYYYCSMGGHAVPPRVSGRECESRLDAELEKRGVWNDYIEHLANIIGGNSPKKMLRAKPEQKALAALAAIGSKYVQISGGSDE